MVPGLTVSPRLTVPRDDDLKGGEDDGVNSYAFASSIAKSAWKSSGGGVSKLMVSPVIG